MYTLDSPVVLYGADTIGRQCQVHPGRQPRRLQYQLYYKEYVLVKRLPSSWLGRIDLQVRMLLYVQLMEQGYNFMMRGGNHMNVTCT